MDHKQYPELPHKVIEQTLRMREIPRLLFQALRLNRHLFRCHEELWEVVVPFRSAQEHALRLSLSVPSLKVR